MKIEEGNKSVSKVIKRGVCFVISAPSGAGKSSIAEALRAHDERIFTSISVTTRAPRLGEEEGVHYYFRDLAQFHKMIAQGELIEWAEVFGRGYGTPLAPVYQALEEGRDVILDIDWQGYRQVKKALPEDVVGLFILPPSLEVLEGRLRGRQTESEEEIAKRMKAAQDEISHYPEFDYVIINDHLETAIEEAKILLKAQHFATKRRKDIMW